jgi:hypothetical protein
MVDRPCTAAPSSPEFRPPTAPVSMGAGQGVGEGELNTGNSVGGSPGRERRCGGQASRRRGGEEGARWGECSGAGNEKGGAR